MAHMTVSAMVVAVLVGCCVVGVVVAEVELEKGTRPLNHLDPVQYKDCLGLRKAGYNESGVHVLYMNKTRPFLIHCEFTRDNAFSVIQRRMDNSVNFMQGLKVYQQGFGNPQGDYWAGLDAINHLTMAAGNKVLTFDLMDKSGRKKTAVYSYFAVQPHHLYYQMTVAGFYSRDGLADDFSHSSGMYFYTYDYPDTQNCALGMKGGWWYNYCAFAMLNGYYYPPGTYVVPPNTLYDGIFWRSFGGFNYSLKFTTMKVSTN